MTALALALGYFMVILDVTVVNVALARIGRALDAGTSVLQWVVDGYTLVFAALLISGGALSDRLGARRVLLAGLALFIGASAACGLAPAAPELVAARVVQGAGAALVVPASLALVRAAYADRASRARALGLWGGIAGIAAASGPLVGGVLVTAVGWRAVFFVNVPVGAAAMALVVRRAPDPAPQPAALDVGAQAAGALALASLTFALIEAGARGWAAPEVLIALGACLAALGAFAAVARPAFPRAPGFAAGTAVGLLINLGFYGELFVLGLYFQRERGDSALTTGVALLPMLGMATAASVVSGRVMGRTGARPPMIAGLAIGAAGYAGLAAAGAGTAYPLLAAPLVAVGFGMALTMPAATAAVVESVPAERAGVASGVLNAARQVGSAIGVALLGTLGGLPAASAAAGAAFAIGIAAAWRV